jgi:hypothetical protein
MKLSVVTAFFTFMAVMREIAALPDCNTHCSTTELSVATGTAFVMSSLGFTPVLKARRWEPALSISARSAPVQSWAEPAWTPSPVSQPYWTPTPTLAPFVTVTTTPIFWAPVSTSTSYIWEETHKNLTSTRSNTIVATVIDGIVVLGGVTGCVMTAFCRCRCRRVKNEGTPDAERDIEMDLVGN